MTEAAQDRQRSPDPAAARAPARAAAVSAADPSVAAPPAAATLEPALQGLRAAITAADALALDASDAKAVLDEAEQRLRLPVDALVVILAGGTGVGKSSILNAIAGAELSPASALRPTTAQPVAWFSAADPGLEAVLRWFGVAEFAAWADGQGPGATGPRDSNGKVAVVDLPDLDSMDETHRRRVEELLPKADAVVWVADPEKYADAVMHRQFLARWARRLDSQVLVINKRDLLTPADAGRIVADAASLLRSAGLTMPVLQASATMGPEGVAGLRAWLDRLGSEKAAAIGRLAASAGQSARDLATVAGVDPERGAAPLVPADRRRAAVEGTTRELLRIADLDGVRRLAVAATEQEALRKSGPVAWFRLAARSVGLAAAGELPAPRRHLQRWRERGSLVRAAEPAVPALRAAVSAAAPPLRPRLAAAAQPVAIARRLEPLMDTLASTAGGAEPDVPTARGWGTLGILQSIAAGIAILAVVWLAAGLVIRLPFTADAGTLVAIALIGAAIGILVRFGLRQYARLVGRRWGRALSSTAERSIRERTEIALFDPIDSIERARQALAAAALQAGGGRGSAV